MTCGCCAKKKDCCKKDVVSETAKLPDRNGFAASSDAGAGFNYASNDNYNFNLSNSTLLEPVSAGVLDGVSQVKSFLDANPNQVFNVVGHYKSSETNNSAFPDLGLARANTIKNHLESQGISTKLISTSSMLNDDAVESNDTLFGPVTFSFATASAEGTDWSALGDKLRKNPLVLNFNTAKASIDLSAEQRQKVADIVNYLDHVDGAKCLSLGHTDNDGSDITNARLGKRRADFAKNYLVQNGISSSKIDAISRGSNVPIADNATEAGRAKNRRTVVTIN